MILVFVLCGVLYLLTIYFSIYTYYEMKKNNDELEKRLLQLEKRDNEKASRRDLDGVYDTFANSINELQLELYQLKKKKCKCKKEV